MKEKLKEMLHEKRYVHSVNVAETAKALARRYGADPQKAYTAGLLHDAAKNLSISQAYEVCGRLEVRLDNIEMENTVLIHATLGAEYIKEQFGIDDSDIVNAVRYHTTGRANMSTLEKVVYLADMIEPDRTYDEVHLLRKLSEEDLDKACLAAFTAIISLNLNQGKLIHPNTILARNDLILSIEN